MFEIENYYDFIKTDKGTEKKPNLHAIHFKRFRAYNPNWSIYKIVLFEFLLHCHKRHGDRFTQKFSQMIEGTRLSKNSLLKYIEELENEGLLTVKRSERKGKNSDRLNRYSLNFDKIVSSLDSIYNFEECDPKDIPDHKEKLAEWYRFLQNNPYRKNSVKTLDERNLGSMELTD